MELREPRRKSKSFIEAQPVFPIFIASEIGIPIDNWVPFVCTGMFDGRSVIVSSPAEISALYSMGNFGKGSNSRSKPHIIRNHPSLPQILRDRQYGERLKWIENIPSKRLKRETQNSEVIEEIHSIFEQLCAQNIIEQDGNNVNLNNHQNKSEVIDILSSDEENKQNKDPQSSGQNYSSKSDILTTNNRENPNTVLSDSSTINAIDLEFPPGSVIVLPDSDSENDDYFKNVKAKLCIDESNLFETLILSMEESYFLAYGLGCLQIIDLSKKLLTLENSWNLFCETQKKFPIKYAVYHHFRSKGWIVKPGIKFGGDFLLYKKGQLYYHATYIVIIQEIDSHKNPHSWLSIQNFVRLSATAAKEILLVNIIVPEEINLKESPKSIENIIISETLLRRWTTGQKINDNE